MILGVSRIIRARRKARMQCQDGEGMTKLKSKSVFIHWSMNIDRIAGYLVRLMNFITSIP